MRSAVDVAIRPEFAIRSVDCRDDHAGWSEAEVRHTHNIVLARRGRFRRLASGAAADIDPTVGYIGVPGEEERFAHPAGGDLCTWVCLPPASWRLMAGEAAGEHASTVYVDARLDLAHRRILAAGRAGDVDYAVTEELLGLLSIAIRQAGTRPERRATATDRALVGAARDAIATDHPAATGLLDLAELLDASPYRLSRAFSSHLGVSLTRYRNRVRVGRVLDRLEDGQSSLGAIAADLGFADQAHLGRTVRDHLGYTPTALRHLLARHPLTAPVS